MTPEVAELARVSAEEQPGFAEHEAAAEWQALVEFAEQQLRCRRALPALEEARQAELIAWETLTTLLNEHWEELGEGRAAVIEARGDRSQRLSESTRQWSAVFKVAYARQRAEAPAEVLYDALDAVLEIERAAAERQAAFLESAPTPAAPEAPAPEACATCGSIEAGHSCTAEIEAEAERNEAALQEAAPPVRVPCPHYGEIRRFFAIAQDHCLNVEPEAAPAMRAAMSRFFNRPIHSRRQLDGSEWAQAASAVQDGVLSW
jgi:hypothetical protein